MDPVDCYYNAYLYASSNPVMRTDLDGRLDVLSHWIIGGWHELAGDFWRSSNPLVKHRWINHKGMERLAKAIHEGKYTSAKEINEFFNNNKPSDFNMTRAQWEGFRQHAINDAFHEYGSPYQLPYSPIEMGLYFAGKDSTGSSRILAKYQDAAGGIALASLFVPGVGSSLLQYDYMVSMVTHLIQNAVIEV